jgi:putative acetyltransferase
LIVSAFGQNAEADLVDRLRKSSALTHSLVAEDAGQIVGHLALSPVTIHRDEVDVSALGLAPLAVSPARQRQGIGTRLVSHWLRNIAQGRENLVVVLGHPDYYPRFGFRSAKPYGIFCEYNVPDNVFMVLALRPDALTEIDGVVRYHREFSEL